MSPYTSLVLSSTMRRKHTRMKQQCRYAPNAWLRSDRYCSRRIVCGRLSCGEHVAELHLCYTVYCLYQYNTGLVIVIQPIPLRCVVVSSVDVQLVCDSAHSHRPQLDCDHHAAAAVLGGGGL